LSERFQGAKCCLLSNSDDLLREDSFGFECARKLDRCCDSDVPSTPKSAANQVVAISTGYDLTFVHLILGLAKEQLRSSSDILDDLVACILRALRREHGDAPKMFVLLLGHGTCRVDYGPLLSARLRRGCDPPVPYIPKQSFEFTEGKAVDDWLEDDCVLAIHSDVETTPAGCGSDNGTGRPVARLVRRDALETCSMAGAMAKGGNGVILATQFLKGLMYNLQKAPKYGA